MTANDKEVKAIKKLAKGLDMNNPADREELSAKVATRTIDKIIAEQKLNAKKAGKK